MIRLPSSPRRNSCELEDGPSLAAESARRLACDASVVRIVCRHTRYVDGHHIQHWADGGETRLGNLVLLCRFHHRLVHEGDVVVRILDDGALQFLKPNGRPFEDETAEIGRVAGDWTQLVAVPRQQDLDIDATTAVTRWRGEVMDYDLAVQALLQRANRVPREKLWRTVSRTTS